MRITFDLWNSVEQAGSVKKSSFISSRRFFLTSRVSEFGECTECESLLHYYWSQLHFPEFETKFFSQLQERFFKELTWKCTFLQIRYLDATKHMEHKHTTRELIWELFGYISGYIQYSDISSVIPFRIYPKSQFHNRYIQFLWIYPKKDMLGYIPIVGYIQDISKMDISNLNWI